MTILAEKRPFFPGGLLPLGGAGGKSGISSPVDGGGVPGVSGGGGEKLGESDKTGVGWPLSVEGSVEGVEPTVGGG